MNWTCPYCDRPQIVSDGNRASESQALVLKASDLGDVGFNVNAITCLNENCKKLTLSLVLYRRHENQRGIVRGPAIRSWRILPDSHAVPQPDYIPAALREDYEQACRVRDLSPKASATLSRRCLQGMIRDFAKVAKPTLNDEVRELRKLVDNGAAPQGVTAESVEAIDHVRSIGNIGAHMERDINLIIDVDPGEAEALTDLIEILFKEWYVARNQRQQSLARVAQIAAEKKAALLERKSALPLPLPSDRST